MEVTSLILGIVVVLIIVFLIRRHNQKYWTTGTGIKIRKKLWFKTFHIPRKSLEKMTKRKEESIKEIIIHCSDTDDPNITAKDINEWHLARGWCAIGYHFFIRTDGTIEFCRPTIRVGSHCYGHNKYSIGICVNGKKFQDNTTKREKSLNKLLKELQRDYQQFFKIKFKIKAHRDYTDLKTCPNFSVSKFLKTSKIVYCLKG